MLKFLIKLNTLSISRALYIRGYLSKEEFDMETFYNYSSLFRLWMELYCFLVTPIGKLILKSDMIARCIHPVARKVWIDRAIRKGTELLEIEEAGMRSMRKMRRDRNERN